jgi:hypothetical protein
VNVAMRFVLSSATVPVGLTQGAVHETLNDVPAASGATGSLNVAVSAELADTLVAPDAGVLAVTVGGAVAT